MTLRKVLRELVELCPLIGRSGPQSLQADPAWSWRYSAVADQPVQKLFGDELLRHRFVEPLVSGTAPLRLCIGDAARQDAVAPAIAKADLGVFPWLVPCPAVLWSAQGRSAAGLRGLDTGVAGLWACLART